MTASTRFSSTRLALAILAAGVVALARGRPDHRSGEAGRQGRAEGAAEGRAAPRPR